MNDPTFKNNRWQQHFKKRHAALMDLKDYHQFAILVPLLEINGKLHFVFQIRSDTIRQPGEVCFPGGKVDDSDQSYRHAAVRELAEELGIPEAAVQVIGELDYMITPFRLMLYPFLGILDKNSRFHINENEVKEIFFIPVDEALQLKPKNHYIFLNVEPEKGFPFHLIPNGENYTWRTGTVTEQFYEYNGYIIWGLTARIFTHVLEELKKC
ncbi:8-oxo-dGTP pyrophosphatase MutT, NUDIX family [Evansella caseinilytica]|uniref:8-oxo-dGTP pyrophosphatase MutT, NUDIX family n=1 Tax=Evansella caseinilytica TaxID=1503961 RepID=A0A1H3KC53_9BACI|nr:CoA pyrophosphatase [Evansella caseinilytica]SDY49499.1 8-oxo-dGTP pyrophosphatase MutT, NUDIX family [Evansella caseinilytica]